MAERLREVAELAMRCRNECVPAHLPALSQVTRTLREQAARLEMV